MTQAPYQRTPVPYNLRDLPRYVDEELSRISLLLEDIRYNTNRWQGYYDPARCYERGDIVRDENWLMVANKATCDRPAPQPKGQPFWASGLGDAPSWELASVGPQPVYLNGQRYTFSQSGYVVGFRAWMRSAADVDHRYYIVDRNGPVPIFNRIMELPEIYDQWANIAAPIKIVLAGEEYDVLLSVISQGATSSFSGTWDYKTKNGTPDDGEAWHQSNNYEIRINHTDSADADRSAELGGLTVGDTLQIGTAQYEITDVDDRASHIRLDLEPATRISENEYTFQFVQYADASLPFVRINGHYTPNPDIVGIRGQDYDSLVVNQAAYGVDILVQEAEVSPDWDFMSYYEN